MLLTEYTVYKIPSPRHMICYVRPSYCRLAEWLRGLAHLPLFQKIQV